MTTSPKSKPDPSILDRLDQANDGIRNIHGIAVVTGIALGCDSPPSEPLLQACLSAIQAEAKRVEEALSGISYAGFIARHGQEVPK